MCSRLQSELPYPARTRCSPWGSPSRLPRQPITREKKRTGPRRDSGFPCHARGVRGRHRKSRRDPLLSRFRVAHHRIHQPDDLAVFINAIPEASTGGHFVLPLLHLLTVYVASPQVATKRMLPFRSRSRIDSELLPSDTSVRRGSRADLFPPVDSVARAVPKVPTCWGRRRSDSFSTLRHVSRCRWGHDRSTFSRLDAHSEPLGQTRVGVDFCGGSPLADNLCELAVGVHLRRCDQRPGEFIEE